MNNAPQRLLALLDAERNALMTGNYDQLQGIAAEKQALIAALQRRPPQDTSARLLRERLSRNEALMRSASVGFREGIQALSRYKAAARTTLYHPDGSAQIRPNSARAVERKA